MNRLVTAANDAKLCGSIARVMSPQNIGYASVLETFKIDHEAYLSVKDDNESRVTKVNDEENDRKVVRWLPIFKYFLSNSYGSRGPLLCVLCENPTVVDAIVGPLLANCYYGESGSLISELESLIQHSGPINAAVYVKF